MQTKFTVECVMVHEPLKEDITILLMRFLTSEEMTRKLYDETGLVLNALYIVKLEDER